MSTVNTLNPTIDATVQIFDRFYNYQQNVSATEYDVVHSYFLSVFATAAQAGNFTVTLFRIASLSNIVNEGVNWATAYTKFCLLFKYTTKSQYVDRYTNSCYPKLLRG
jgi:hypothetical protein